MAYETPHCKAKKHGRSLLFSAGPCAVRKARLDMSTRNEMKPGAKVANKELSADGTPRLTGPGLPLNSWPHHCRAESGSNMVFLSWKNRCPEMWIHTNSQPLLVNLGKGAAVLDSRSWTGPCKHHGLTHIELSFLLPIWHGQNPKLLGRSNP